MYLKNNTNNFFHGIMFHHFHDSGVHSKGPGSLSKDEFYKIINFVGRKNILDANEIKYEVNTNSLWDYFMSDSQAETLRKVDKSTVYLECWAQPDSEIGESLNSIRLLKSKNLK